MIYLTYYINKNNNIECMREEEHEAPHFTAEKDIIEAGLIYTSKQKYKKVIEKKNEVTFICDEYELTIKDYEEIMNRVDVAICEDFQRKIEIARIKSTATNFVRGATVGSMVLSTMAGVAVIAASQKPEANTNIVLTTEPFYQEDVSEKPESQNIVMYSHRTEDARRIEEPEEIEEEDIVIPEVVTSSYPTPVITADNRINISGIKQTGICKDYTNYVKFYSRWTPGSNQRAIADIWDANGRTSDRGIATIDDRYLVAMTTTFGYPGSYVDVILEDGTVIPCIIADAKSPRDANCNAYGHEKGRRGTSIVEFETVVDFDGIDISGWQNQAVRSVQLYPGLNILNPVESMDEIEEAEYSDEMIEMVIDELEQELNEEIASIYETDELSPIYIEDEFIDYTQLEEPVEEMTEETVRVR